MKRFTTPAARLPAQRSATPARFASKLVCLLILVGCHAHQAGNIEEYIQSLERPSRDTYQQPDRVLQALNLQPGMAIADLGAGSGYFTRRFAHALDPAGLVIAVDVDPRMLEYNQAHLANSNASAPVKFILALPDDPSLPAQSVDLIFLCNVYHHLTNHAAYMAKAKAALKPNGRVAIIDFYHDARSGVLGFPKHHLVPRERVIHDMEQAGFQLLKEHTFLPRQYFLEFAPQS
ncbi:MAG: methyltransferase domain-containing protein [Nitrospirae bacterium]|nr:MAG: methyltransferase domain-containing protein [Nitrospirota bacterium]